MVFNSFKLFFIGFLFLWGGHFDRIFLFGYIGCHESEYLRANIKFIFIIWRRDLFASLSLGYHGVVGIFLMFSPSRLNREFNDTMAQKFLLITNLSCHLQA
jgi:hypothetical protein